MYDVKLPVLVCGQGPVAARVGQMLQSHGVPVRYGAKVENTPLAAVVDCTEGLTPALDNAMKALGRGIPVITCNALLVGVHGRVLANASLGQQTPCMFGAALGAAQPVAAWLPTAGAHTVTLVEPMGANAILRRMVQRDDDMHKATTALEAQGDPLSNASGKTTYVQGLALHGAVAGTWLAPEAAQRTGLEMLTKPLMAHMRRFGLAPLYTVSVQHGRVQAGVVACNPQSPLMNGQIAPTVVVETAAGTHTLSHSTLRDDSTAAAMVADVLVCQTPTRLRLPRQGFAAAPHAHTLIVGEYAQRHRVLEAGGTVLDEHITPHGDWLAVVQSPAPLSLANLLAVPVAGGFTPQSGSLRLVG
ncbi:MAG: hypothetical protein WAZ18_06050 [Alphaproteobacteria bacterium]